MNPEADMPGLGRNIPGCALALALMVLSGSAPASDSGCISDRDVRPRAMGELTHRQLNQVYEAVGEGEYDEAYEDLERMLRRAGNDEYVRAIINQALAQVEWSRENYDSALRYFEKAIELDALPNDAHFGMMYQLAQLYYMNEDYSRALDRLDAWLCTAAEEKIDPTAYVLQASIHGATENYTEALESINKAISMEAEPREQWYQLKLGVLYELERFPQVAETLASMVEYWPAERLYWVQLAQVYYQLKQEDRALAALALAYRKGLFEVESDFAFLSSLYSNGGVPYKAANVLEDGIENGVVEPSRSNWVRVAEEWYNAAELDKSLDAYEKAGRASADGGIDLRRGYILVDLERWMDAKTALDAAIEKGGLNARRTGEAYLLRGMTHFNLEDLEAAGRDWREARRYEPTRTAAEQWIAHLREERRRQAL